MPLFLHNARLIDGTGSDVVPDAVVVVDGSRIVWAGPAADAPSSDGLTRVDVGGHTICPGFFDCHVHLSLPGGTASAVERLQVRESYHTYQLISRLRATVESGVTTVRDLMGVDAGVRQAVADGLIEGPRLLVAINMLSQSCGHADFRLPCGLDLSGLLGGVRVDSVDEVRKKVRELFVEGADVIKIASSGGVSSPNDRPEWLGMRPEMITAVIEECAAYGGRAVAAHAIGYAGIKAAVEAGVTSIEHGYELDDALRQRMVDQGTFLVPTLSVTLAESNLGGMSPGAKEKSAHWHDVAHASVRESVAFGVKVALGTDAGLSPAHGNNLAELGHMVRLGGMSPMDAIVAGTRSSAELCGLADSLGTVEAGKLADLVVVRGDPLDDIDSVGDASNILLVLKEGRLVIDRAGFLA